MSLAGPTWHVKLCRQILGMGIFPQNCCLHRKGKEKEKRIVHVRAHMWMWAHYLILITGIHEACTDSTLGLLMEVCSKNLTIQAGLLKLLVFKAHIHDPSSAIYTRLWPREVQLVQALIQPYQLMIDIALITTAAKICEVVGQIS